MVHQITFNKRNKLLSPASCLCLCLLSLKFAINGPEQLVLHLQVSIRAENLLGIEITCTIALVV